MKDGKLVATAALSAIGAFIVAALLVNVFQRKQEANETYVRLVKVTEETTDPEVWGTNFPRQLDSYRKTATRTKSTFGGSESLPDQKAVAEPWLTRFFAGYAFSLDYRDRRGHAYMLKDQEQTRRVTERPQPGACLHCHSSIIPAYRFAGLSSGASPEDAVMRGFEKVCAMKYQDAHDLADKEGKRLVQHPVSCVDCHDPRNMELRVTRPGFINGIKALKESQGITDYDVNKMATRQEMRTFACAQCHVEYYFKGDGKLLTYPWRNGLKVEEIEKYYDDNKVTDFKHAETGAPILKAQHPEFELYSQGIHARSGVSCADCHMPYQREGALKVSDHWVRSPMININRACQQCHHHSESEMRSRVDTIQQRNHALMRRAADSLTSFLDRVKTVRGPVDAKTQADPAFVALAKDSAIKPDELKKKSKEALDARWMKTVDADPGLKTAMDLHRKAQWRLDFVAAENSMGFHAPQEAARILGEAIDYFRQAELAVERSQSRK